MEINGKWLIIQGVKNNNCPTLSAFLAIFKRPSPQTDATLSNLFQSCLNNVGSELCFLVLKSVLWGLEKVGSNMNS